MKISKTKFMNYSRCNRNAALDMIQMKEERAIVSFSDELELENLMNEENKKSKQRIIEEFTMTNENKEDEVLNAQLEMMMPYYNKLEVITGKYIKELFGGNVIYDLNTFNQKRFEYQYNDYSFYCFLDGYQEDENTIRIFETKTTTSNKFSEEKFNVSFKGENNDVYKKGFFKQESDIIYKPLEDYNIDLENTNYYKREELLKDKYNERGKYIYDLAFQRYVFENAIKTNKKVEYYLVVLNHEYIHDGTDSYPKELLRMYNLTSLTQKMISLIKEDVDVVIERLNTMNASPVKLGSHCERGKNNECPFTDICYKELLGKYNIFEYLYSTRGFKDLEGNSYSVYDLIDSGMTHILDVPESYLNRPNNVLQRRVLASDRPHYNKQKIRDGINLLKHPIYHLDFESFNCPLPRYKGEAPYMQSLFQYSVHIESKPGVCDFDKDHYSFLATDHSDQREELVKTLTNIIKDDGGSVLVYNVAFEKTRLKELKKLFPKYKDKLNNIIERLFDLQDIVRGNKNMYLNLGYSLSEASELNYYHKDLGGSYSIKKLLPLFSNLSYDNLIVGNGLEAMQTYVSFPNLEKDVFNEKYNELVKYCKQDTWAMYEILSKLREI